MLDRRWWTFLHDVLDQLESRNMREIYRIEHAQHLASLPVSSAEGLQKSWHAASQITIKMINSLFPWFKIPGENEQFQESVERMRSQWTSEWGDMNDPETQKRIWATACALDPSMAPPPDLSRGS